MKKLLIPALLAALLTACGSTPSTDEGAPVEGRTADSGKISTVRTDGVEATGLPRELTDAKSVLSKRSIYFDLDKYDIKDQYKDLVAAHAKFLSNNRQFKVLLQGNTDERGSREYNLSLGQKRSDAVKRNLICLLYTSRCV